MEEPDNIAKVLWEVRIGPEGQADGVVTDSTYGVDIYKYLPYLHENPRVQGEIMQGTAVGPGVREQ